MGQNAAKLSHIHGWITFFLSLFHEKSSCFNNCSFANSFRSTWKIHLHKPGISIPPYKSLLLGFLDIWPLLVLGGWNLAAETPVLSRKHRKCMKHYTWNSWRIYTIYKYLMRWTKHRCTIIFRDPLPFDIKHVMSDVCAGLKPAGLGGIIESPQVATEMAMWPTWKQRQLFPKTKNWIQNFEMLKLCVFLIIHPYYRVWTQYKRCLSIPVWGIQQLKFLALQNTLPPLAGRTLWMRKSMAWRASVAGGDW